MSDKVRWGTLGSSRFLVANSFPEISRGDLAVLTSVASRSTENAELLRARLGVEKAYGSYEALLADPDIEVVYNALPNDLHAEWSLRALEAGKHVLCEKPLTPSAREARELVEAASSFSPFLFEGYMWRHHPQWHEVARLLSDGVIGDATVVRSHYCYFDRDPVGARNSPAHGGGALLLIGCYPIAMSMLVFAGQEPRRVLASIDMDPDFGVDRLAACTIEFDDGRALFSVGTQLWDDQTFTVYGTSGWLQVDVPVTPGAADPAILHLDTEASGPERIELPPASQFALQADAVSRDIRDNQRPSLTLGVRVLQVIDSLKTSAITRTWVDIPTES